MTDRHDEDTENLNRPTATPPPAGEGVRIIGAEEAQAAIDAGAAAGRLGESEPRFGDVPDRPDASQRPDVRFPRSEDDASEADEPTAEHPGLLDEIAAATGAEPTGPEPRLDISDTDAGGGDDGPETAAIEATPQAPVGLPHWTEPATGEVPVIAGEGFEAVEASESSGRPHFQTGSSGWTQDDLETLAVLGTEPDAEAPVPVTPPRQAADDDDVEFDREVAARRVRSAPSARPRPASTARTGRGADELDLGGDRPDTVVRVVTGLGIAALALVCLSAGPAATMVLATAVVTACAFEMFQALHTRGFRPATIIGLLGVLTIVPLAYHRGEFAFPFTLALVMVFTLLWFIFEVVHTRPMVNVAVTIGGFVYTGVLGAFAGLLLTSENGVGLLLGVAVPVIAYDIFGLVVGSQFGKTRLAPDISPNKTVEGLIGGMAGAVIVAVLIVKLIHPWDDLGHAFALGLTVAVMAPLGDLAESMLKRDLGIKDFGTLLPGHGGVLDRFDSLLFCLPAVYFLARALTIG